MKFYTGNIESLSENQIFVFGSNPEGRHGKGSAKIAKEKFGAIYGNGRGIQGNSYALVTKNLRPCKEYKTGITYTETGEKSLTKEQISENIKELYDFALRNPHLEFFIAYKYDTPNLNGYSSEEMFSMFTSHEIPNNIVFHESFIGVFDNLNW